MYETEDNVFLTVTDLNSSPGPPSGRVLNASWSLFPSIRAASLGRGQKKDWSIIYIIGLVHIRFLLWISDEYAVPI